jgi:hypothetical protein
MKGEMVEPLIFYCRPDERGIGAHYWDGNTGLLVRPPKAKSPAESARCPRHVHEADEAKTQKPRPWLR